MAKTTLRSLSKYDRTCACASKCVNKTELTYRHECDFEENDILDISHTNRSCLLLHCLRDNRGLYDMHTRLIFMKEMRFDVELIDIISKPVTT